MQRSKLARAACVAGLVVAATTVHAQLVMTEILFDPVGVDGGRQVIELTNVGPAPVEMGDGPYWLYWAPARWQFPAGVVVAPGAVVTVHVAAAGEATESEFFTGVSGARVLSRTDAVGLYRSSLFGDPEEILDFVQWGGAGQSGEEVAVSAGIWGERETVEVDALRGGASIAYDGSGDSAADWCVDGSATIGAPNDTCTTSFASTQIRLSEIGFARPLDGPAHFAIELEHRGDVLEDISGRLLALDGVVAYELPLGVVLAPGELLVVHLGIDGEDSLFDLYPGVDLTWAPGATGSASLHASPDLAEGTALLDYVDWGLDGAVRAGAVAAGLWSAGEAVDASERRNDGSIALVEPDAVGAARFGVDNTGTIGRQNDEAPDVAVVVNEVLIDPLGADAGGRAVELLNLYAEAVDVSGYSLCVERPDGSTGCATLPEGTAIAAGELLVILWNRTGPDTAGTVHTGPVAEFDPAGGSLALGVTPRREVADDLVDFLAWGEHDGAREDQALAIGLWPNGDRIDVSAIVDGSSIAYDGVGDAAASYRLDDSPSIGLPNVEPPPQEPFRRGDCNDDGSMDISDAIALFNLLFTGGFEAHCEDACDANDDEGQDISDPVFILNSLFRGGFIPPPPRGECGAEDTPEGLTCEAYTSC